MRDFVVRVGDRSIGQPVDPVGDPIAGADGGFSNGSDQNSAFNPDAFVQVSVGANRSENAPRNLLRELGSQQWDIALFKNISVKGTHKLQLRMEVFNS